MPPDPGVSKLRENWGWKLLGLRLNAVSRSTAPGATKTTITKTTYLLGPHKQQMFHSMRHATHVFLVTEIAHIDIHSRTGLIRLRIVNQKNLQLIRQSNDPIAPIIQAWRLKAIRKTLDRSMSVLSQRTIQGRWRLGLG